MNRIANWLFKFIKSSLAQKKTLLLTKVLKLKAISKTGSLKLKRKC